MSTLERAIEIAARKHLGKVDKAGEPYILHPLRVMLRLPTTEPRIVGVLHDVLEDTDTTADELLAQGFSTEIVRALEALTKRKGESYMEFVRRAAKNILARQVKLADLRDNLDPDRLAKLPADEAARLRAKYGPALEFLEAQSEGFEPVQGDS